MNSNYSLVLTAKGEYKGNDYEITFDPYSDYDDEDSLRQALLDEIIQSGDFEEPIDASEIEIEITDYDSLPDSARNTLEDVFEFAKAFAECEQDIEVVEAAVELGIDPDNIDEAYQGEWKSDEDFARSIAEDTGAVNNDANWPYTCIDWEWAAREIMMDYSEANGHYFRDL